MTSCENKKSSKKITLTPIELNDIVAGAIERALVAAKADKVATPKITTKTDVKGTQELTGEEKEQVIEMMRSLQDAEDSLFLDPQEFERRIMKKELIDVRSGVY